MNFLKKKHKVVFFSMIVIHLQNAPDTVQGTNLILFEIDTQDFWLSAKFTTFEIIPRLLPVKIGLD